MATAKNMARSRNVASARNMTRARNMARTTKVASSRNMTRGRNIVSARNMATSLPPFPFSQTVKQYIYHYVINIGQVTCSVAIAGCIEYVEC
jgi:hypothetical protein